MAAMTGIRLNGLASRAPTPARSLPTPLPSSCDDVSITTGSARQGFGKDVLQHFGPGDRRQLQLEKHDCRILSVKMAILAFATQIFERPGSVADRISLYGGLGAPADRSSAAGIKFSCLISAAHPFAKLSRQHIFTGSSSGLHCSTVKKFTGGNEWPDPVSITGAADFRTDFGAEWP